MYMASTIQENNPYLQCLTQWVKAIEVSLTLQWRQYLWWHIVHHPITHKVQYAWEVLGVPVYGSGRGGTGKYYMCIVQNIIKPTPGVTCQER